MKPIFHWIHPKQLLNESDKLGATVFHFRLVHVGFSPREYWCHRAEDIRLTKWKILQNPGNHMVLEAFLGKKWGRSIVREYLF